MTVRHWFYDRSVADGIGVDDERALLGGYLDWYRGVAEHKVVDLGRADATRVATPTGVTLLGIIKHLAWCERRWFPHHLLGGPREPVEVGDSFVVDPSDTVESVIANYRDECARSREIVDAQPALQTRSAVGHDHFGTVTLEWIVVHMIEETARHCGHLDILRELTDGRTGD
jgi:hypothetical protein